MPLLVDTAPSGRSGPSRSAPSIELRGRNCLTIGLVNNMPDAACEATERQFLDLMRAATGDVVVRLKLYAIADVPRAQETRRELATRYRDIAELWDTPLDGLIVTGTEPKAANLRDEPYWPALTGLVDWARLNTASTIWSCLAAHAAVLHADGVVRQPLEKKLSGVFDCEADTDHPLLADVAPHLRVPHSRLNDLPGPALRACGYRVLSRSAAAGVDAFVKEDHGASLFVFFQGHPEYDADSLLREYRRDVGRLLRGERATYPDAPQRYFNNAASFVADDFRMRAATERRGGLLGDFPLAPLAAGIENAWHDTAVGVYRNWINCLKARKRDRKSSGVMERVRLVSA
jgi:homoserine O-succinyltransferase/O-acetyltransferase